MLFYTFFFLFGLIIGSFLNVVIYRYNTGSAIKGRSYCFTCRTQLRWYELVPLFSFLFQRGKCRSCQSLISLQYPLVELVTGVIFASLAFSYNPLVGDPLHESLSLAFFIVVSSILMVIAVYDLRHKIIPDDFVFAFIFLSFLSPIINNLDLSILSIVTKLLNGLLAGGVLFLFFWSLWRFSDGRWMGFGDVKLVVGIGFLLGLAEGISAVVIAFWLGAAVGITLILLNKLTYFRNIFGRLNFKSELPFAPFLVLATILGIVLNLNIIPGF